MNTEKFRKVCTSYHFQSVEKNIEKYNLWQNMNELPHLETLPNIELWKIHRSMNELTC